jgi:hypothetical protein
VSTVKCRDNGFTWPFIYPVINSKLDKGANLTAAEKKEIKDFL